MEAINWQEQLILRLPRFPMARFDQGMEEIWKDEAFRKALKIALPEGLVHLDWASDFDTLPPKIKYTLWKYANRMCYRATPFGAFTGMGVWTWGEQEKLVIDPSAFETRFCRRMASTKKVTPYINRLSYPFGGGSRFLNQQQDQVQNPWIMNEIPDFPFPDDPQNFRNFKDGEEALLKEIGWLQDQWQQVKMERVDEKGLTPQGNELAHTLYTASGTLAQDLHRELALGRKALEKLAPSATFSALNTFKNGFLKRFEYHTVPILLAIDPDIGVAYSTDEPQKKEYAWTPIHRYLMEQWLQMKAEGSRVLDLKLEEIPIAEQQKVELNVPDQALLFSCLKDRIWLRQAAPLGSISLIARMIPFDERIEKLASQIIKQEAWDQQVIHADILYHGESIMEKVSLPFGLRKHQLVIHPQGGAPPENLDWQELVLKMEGDRLRLYSLKYQKRVIPHLNSAYNTHRDKLPLFRLLVDLQYESLNCNGSFHLQDYFPNLSYYPRVMVEGVILQPARWIIGSELLKKWKTLKDMRLRIAAFQAYAHQVQLPQSFVLKQGDQGLVFHRNRSFDLEVFCSLWQQQALVLEEQLFEEGCCLKVDLPLTGYAHECIAFCFNPQIQSQENSRVIEATYLEDQVDPQWLGIYIYLDPELQDRFLRSHCLSLFKTLNHTNHSPFQRGYFLRYVDEIGPHLRIRFQSSPNAEPLFHAELLNIFQEWNALPFVKMVTIHSYQPENWRYRYLGMQKTADLFQQSSLSTLEQISEPDSHSLMAYALASLWQLMEKCPEMSQEMAGMKAPSLGEHQNRFMHQWNEEFRDIKSLLLLHHALWMQEDPFLKAIASLSLPYDRKTLAADYFFALFHMHINRLFPSKALEKEYACYRLFPKMKAFFSAKGLWLAVDGKG